MHPFPHYNITRRLIGLGKPEPLLYRYGSACVLTFLFQLL